MRGGKPVLPNIGRRADRPGAAVRAAHRQALSHPEQRRRSGVRRAQPLHLHDGAGRGAVPRRAAHPAQHADRRAASPNFFRRINAEQLGTQNMDTPAAIAAFINGEGGIYPTGTWMIGSFEQEAETPGTAAVQELCRLSLSAAVGRACRVRQRPQLGRSDAQAHARGSARRSRASSSSWPRTISTGRGPAISPRSSRCSTTRDSSRCRTAPTSRRWPRSAGRCRATSSGRTRSKGIVGEEAAAAFTGQKTHRQRARRRRAAGQRAARASRLSG